ncbi:MAG: DNA gyrase inhibitor YacG [Gammaproteobacteria bacterium RIFOXYA12_FULL_61_12]|nr:MAG: DNA gyrase inhibitor YacG [Gammaproteobacteria bacterium RIFOXYD12_FULL_61_37]OGT92034.1 MAG: DNA gyrase inhibitor YacG [Gammaproteobacteria bacterium RIFOXYA12_FULL_61_12]
MKQVLCPTCGKRVAWDQDSPWRPFCSERCKLIDLGEWFGENRRLPVEETELAETEGWNGQGGEDQE